MNNRRIFRLKREFCCTPDKIVIAKYKSANKQLRFKMVNK